MFYLVFFPMVSAFLSGTASKNQPPDPLTAVAGRSKAQRPALLSSCPTIRRAARTYRLTVLALTHVLNHSLPNGPWSIHPIVGTLIMGFENYIILYWIEDRDDHPPT